MTPPVITALSSMTLDPERRQLSLANVILLAIVKDRIVRESGKKQIRVPKIAPLVVPPK
jgi:hypothetical protein